MRCADEHTLKGRLVADIRPFVCGRPGQMPYHCAIAPINGPIEGNPRTRGFMATFEEVGFLSDELDQWKNAAQKAYADPFGYANRANGMALRIMMAIPLQDLSEEMKWAIRQLRGRPVHSRALS
jgi:hypothetical protein